MDAPKVGIFQDLVESLPTQSANGNMRHPHVARHDPSNRSQQDGAAGEKSQLEYRTDGGAAMQTREGTSWYQVPSTKYRLPSHETSVWSRFQAFL